MGERDIKRIAFLQEYRNRPGELKGLMAEIKAKGYHAAAMAVMSSIEFEAAQEVAAEAAKYDLEFMAFTGYMKYQNAYLLEHPQQRMIFSSDKGATDQDALTINWGCPFNPQFEQRYHGFLRQLGKIANTTEVWINDEAFMGVDPDTMGCYCPVCQAQWKQEYGGEIPTHPFAKPEEKTQLVNWRIRRWNQCHATMKEVLNEDHPVRAIFLTSPICCFQLNPWVSAVDLASLCQGIDGIMTDPYYTFHLSWGTFDMYQPIEVYMSELSRYVRGITGETKVAELCVQGFSHPSFTRPFDERDGWWLGVVPAALGINAITAYTYLLQKAAPAVQEAYEASFALDEYFEQTEPVEFAAIVDSLETRCFDDETTEAELCWSFTRMLTLGKAMRHYGLPYFYLPSAKIETDEIMKWPVVILPGVSCMSEAAKENLRKYVEAGGMLVACGETGSKDAGGEAVSDGFMREVFGLDVEPTSSDGAQFEPVGNHGAFANLPWPDEITAKYFDGQQFPGFYLSYVTEVEAQRDVEVIGAFDDQAGELAGKPALTVRRVGEGVAVYMAGIPSRTFTRRGMASPALNFAGRVLSNLVKQFAGAKSPIRVEGFPPVVPMQQVRPLDARWRPTVEFMPSVGEDLFLAAIPSYFREPGKFQVEIDVPAGKKCRAVRELVAGRDVAVAANDGNKVEIEVEFKAEDHLKVFGFFLE